MSDTSLVPVPRSGILDIDLYVPGGSKAAPGKKLHKLSSNETPLGPSPKAVEAYQRIASKLELYPDGSSTELRQAIAETHGLNIDRVICGNGSDELLHLLAECYLSPGDEAIYSEHGFLVYRISILAAGATPVVAKETAYTTDVDAILAAVTPRTRMVFLANPNNPTGTYIPMAEVRRLHEGLPGNVLLVLDAAYAEYVRRNDYAAGIELVAESENVVMTRTFSKMRTPPLRAPLARDCVMSAGLALPSPGSHTAPTRSSVRMIGYLSPACCGVSGSHTTPCPLAMAADRRNRVMRSSVRATISEPDCFQPVARPVSASSFE